MELNSVHKKLPVNDALLKELQNKVPLRKRVAPILLHLVIFSVIALWVLPLIGVVMNSFRPFTEATGSGWWTVVRNPKFTLDNYRQMMGMKDLYSGLINSVLITVPTVILLVLVATSAAFALLRTGIPKGRLIYSLIVGMIIVPPEITLYPTLVILKTLHLVNTYPGIWMSHIASATPFGVFLMGSFIQQIPNELFEAARMDGAKLRHLMFKIVMPLAGSAMASLAIFDFLWVWNDLLRSLVIISDPSMRPLTAVLANTAGGYGEFITVQAAGAVLLMLPPLAVFLLAQKYFIRGVLAGAVKS